MQKHIKEVKDMSNNFWLGNIELVIVFRNGRHIVWEIDNDDRQTVFDGHYEKCLEYCKNREISYMESIIG